MQVGHSMPGFKVERVTDFTMTRVRISWENYWKLPSETRELLRLYARELPGRFNGPVTFEMASHRWPDIEATMRRIEDRR